VILGLLAVTDLLCDYAILSGALALAISSEWYIIGTALLFISSIVLYWYLIRIWTDSVHNQFKEKEKRV
jgi:dolichyl-phosphate-mannose--protein O-mannosyl transferase